MAADKLTRHSFHGDWNYTISPHQKTPRKNKKMTELFMDGS